MTPRLLSTVSLALALATIGGASAIVPRSSSESNPGFLSFPIEHARHVRSISTIAKRDADVQLFNVSSVSYLIQLSIGTPGQSVKVAVDTGSDELWVDPNCLDRTLVQQQQQECVADGQYNPDNSSSATTSGISATANTIPYGKGTVQIAYVKDDISLPGSSAALTSVQFGVATRSQELNEGIMGIGFGAGLNTDYNNIIDELAAQKVTNSKAFSVALGSVDANNGGVIIFGGVDTKKFTGSLVSNPVLGPQFNGDVHRYYVQLTSIALNESTTQKTYPNSSAAVVLDSGSSLSYLPESVFTSLAGDLGAQLDQQSGAYFVDCSLLTSADTNTIDFVFGEVTIKVPVSDFVLQADSQDCILGAMSADPSTGITALLGDTFMRSAYVVFDQTTDTISMAQYANCGQAEQTIPAGGVRIGFHGLYILDYRAVPYLYTVKRWARIYLTVIPGTCSSTAGLRR
ncbi:aspartic peptidase domain-containing protein [Bombardia bombarda]|uniref:Aspartic peptidase domain-containing protein n=1 Tax=Bombardia bombarda TaxID=252184 RepID=A0AA39X745_9PEZI|nr:aspartic peptidase domain-containing protein [Bombardia bombarda]